MLLPPDSVGGHQSSAQIGPPAKMKPSFQVASALLGSPSEEVCARAAASPKRGIAFGACSLEGLRGLEHLTGGDEASKSEMYGCLSLPPRGSSHRIRQPSGKKHGAFQQPKLSHFTKVASDGNVNDASMAVGPAWGSRRCCAAPR